MLCIPTVMIVMLTDCVALNSGPLNRIIPNKAKEQAAAMPLMAFVRF